MAFPPSKPYFFHCPKCNWTSETIRSDVMPFNLEHAPDSQNGDLFSKPICPKCKTPVKPVADTFINKLKTLF